MSEGLRPAPGDQAKVSVSVAVPPGEAFRVFTEEIELWWRRRGPRFRAAGHHRGIIRLEPGVGGRLFEFVRLMGMWWGDLVSALRVHAERR